MKWTESEILGIWVARAGTFTAVIHEDATSGYNAVVRGWQGPGAYMCVASHGFHTLEHAQEWVRLMVG